MKRSAFITNWKKPQWAFESCDSCGKIFNPVSPEISHRNRARLMGLRLCSNSGCCHPSAIVRLRMAMSKEDRIYWTEEKQRHKEYLRRKHA